MTKEEKLELYDRAKEAYYNGEELMSDVEFDELERELGLENKSHVGTRHNPSYTVRHPFIMGSLSKVQIHEKNGAVDWRQYFDEARRYFGDNQVIITPKYDGCSFEIHVKGDEITISTRGDGTYGRDIKDHIIDKIPEQMLNFGGEYVLRGEVLVKKTTFSQFYADQFTNPRSFVAGVLANDFSDDPFFVSKLNDLDVVIYDYRKRVDGEWRDIDWVKLNDYGVFPDRYWVSKMNVDKFEWYYHDMEQYRSTSDYALDGIVIKPVDACRVNNLTDPRPKDCVAIKFIPMLQETEIVDITWSLSKNNEYVPIIWVNPVEMDGRMVQKCSGHNYGYLVEKHVGVGSKIIMSLAGDIIPFLYKVTQTGGDIPMPENHTIDGIHLMAELSDEDDARNQFVNSVETLNIPYIGPATAENIFDYITRSDAMTDEFFDEQKMVVPRNILEINAEDVYFGAGAGKTGNNAKKSFEQLLRQLTLVDVIKSMNFRFCGQKVAEQCANYLTGQPYDFTHLATEGYEWCMDVDSENHTRLCELLHKLSKTFDDFKPREDEIEQKSNQIPVILTGEPNDYPTKAAFLKAHPEYRVTGSWKEVQIVFTNSLESNTGKMKKAREKNIEIRLY